MDAFWGITLIVLIMVGVLKREGRIRDEKDEEKTRHAKQFEQARQDQVIAETLADFNAPESKEEKEARQAAIRAERQREKDIAELKKQGFTDELIATIIPTINNGQ